jgi:chromosome segregation ATPase
MATAHAGGFVMRRQFARRIIFALAILLSVTLCLDEAGAQRRRTKRSRRVTNPVRVVPVAPPPQSAEPQVVSTADQQAGASDSTTDVSGQLPSNTRRRSNRSRVTEAGDEDSMQRTVTDLSTQVNKLSEKLSQMEQQQRTLVDLERLSRAEQRAEALRAQLRDVQEKEGNLQARLEQLDFDLKPENIERSVSGYGSTRPEEARDARRHALESERTRTQAQLDLLVTSRQRLETAIVNADLEVDKLRKRVEEANDTTPQMPPTDTENTEETNTTTTQPTPAPNSSNTPNSSTPPE